MNEPISRYLDGAVLYPELEKEKAHAAIQAVIDYRCRTVCVRPCDIEMAVDLCHNSATEVCAVLNFPHGSGLSMVKTFEAQCYLESGVREIDMVANYGYIRSGAWDLVEQDIRGVSALTGPRGVVLKVILETSELAPAEISRAVDCAVAARADYVKTSTGFASGGATAEAVRAMLEAARGRIEVKASGGIRTLGQARSYIAMGAARLGVGYTSLEAICGGGDSGGFPGTAAGY